MTPRRLAPLALAVALCALPRAVASENGGGADVHQGFVVAKNATDVFAPEFSVRVAGWNSDWGMRKVVELAPDGTAVKQGDVVARFEFGANDALRWIQERIQRAQGDANQGRIQADQAVDALAVEERRRVFEAELASLNLGKERAVSRVQADVYRAARRLADFEVEAAHQRLELSRRAKAAERAWLEQSLEKAKGDLGRYQFYERRFVVRAAHDGVVRHAFNARERRKLKKGDNVGSGQRVMSLAKDEALAVRFFVPEAQAFQVKPGARVLVLAQGSADELAAKVESVDFFPQELGYLLENEGLPNAREKAVQVRATLEDAPASLAAGTEVRVRLQP